MVAVTAIAILGLVRLRERVHAAVVVAVVAAAVAAAASIPHHRNFRWACHGRLSHGLFLVAAAAVVVVAAAALCPMDHCRRSHWPLNAIRRNKAQSRPVDQPQHPAAVHGQGLPVWLAWLAGLVRGEAGHCCGFYWEGDGRFELGFG